MNQEMMGKVDPEETYVSNISQEDKDPAALEQSDVDDKLAKSIIESDEQVIEDGQLMQDAVNQSLSSFSPGLMMEQMVKDFSLAKQIYGESVLQAVFGCDNDYIEKNIKIPEFREELKKNAKENMNRLKRQKLISQQSELTDKAVQLAALIMYVEELDNLTPKGITGEKKHKERSIYGAKDEVKKFQRSDRYKSIASRKSVKTSIRRGHEKVELDDLKVYEKAAKGKCHIIYALDSSGSMKGKKIENAKKAGIALAYKAIEEKDEVGLIVYGKEVSKAIPPTYDFNRLLMEITNTRASHETDMAAAINKAVEQFPSDATTKHLIILSDALPTVGENPVKDTLEAAALAKAHDITISLVGITLDKHGEKFAQDLVTIGRGKLYKVSHLDEIDKLVLEDYYNL